MLSFTTPDLGVGASATACMTCSAPTSAQRSRAKTTPPMASSSAIIQRQFLWQASVGANIARLAALQHGWDGPKSAPIDRDVLNLARALIRESLAPLGDHACAPLVAPMGNGGAQVEWHTKIGEIELELLTGGQAHIWVRDHSSGYELEADSAKAINTFILWAPQIAKAHPDEAHVPLAAADPISAIAA